MLTRRRFATLAGAGAVACFTTATKAGSLLTQTSADGRNFSVMLWTLNDSGSLDQNLERIAQAGYRHVELVGEYQHWSEQDWTRILAKLEALQLSVDALSGLSSGFADPNGTGAFLLSLKNVIPAAKRLGCSQIILLSGNRNDTASHDEQHAASISALQRAAALLAEANLTGVIEPIDRLENPHIYLDGVTEAFSLVRTIASPHLKVLYDLYHEQRGLGNLIEKLEKNIDQVGLIHVADVPGRHEPGTGEVNFCNIFRTLHALRYSGIIAMEFYPTGDIVQTLRKAREDALRCMTSQP